MQPKKNYLIHVIDHVPKENNVLIYDNIFVHVRVSSNRNERKMIGSVIRLHQI